MYPSSPIRFVGSRLVRGTASAALIMSAHPTAAVALPVPVIYEGLQTAPLLHPAKNSDELFQYRKTNTDFHAYTALVIDPVTIYSGPDAQFGSVSQEDCRIIANYLRRQVVETLGKRYRIIEAPEPGAVRVHLTLTGLETSTPVLSTISHLAPVGVVFNSAKEADGSGGTFFGSITYAVELSDASTGEFVSAFITKQTLDALDVTASFGTLDAARTGVRNGVRELNDELAKDGFRQDVSLSAKTNP